MVDEIGQDYKSNLYYTDEAYFALQAFSEAYLVRLYSDAQLCAIQGRRSEIQHNLEVMIDGFNQFNFEEKYQAIIPIYKEDDKYLIQHKIQGHKHITLANAESSEILKKAKAAVVCS